MPWRLDLSPEPARPAPELDSEQARVVAHREGPLLVLAGPGTGKTTTIVEAIAARLGDPMDPLPADSILALTFGRRSAVDLRERLASRVGGGTLPTVATFHSFAYGLLRQTGDAEQYEHPPRLLSGAEEDVRIRELLRGAVVDGSIDWPDDLLGALPTLGLANEVRAAIARARELGLDGDELAAIGRREERPAWLAVGQLARQEQEVMALENVLDYGELLAAAVERARDSHAQQELRMRFRAIYVDEYQDTDPLQVDLLQALATPSTCLVAVGDPDQSIYGFRGADVGGILSFPTTFRRADGAPAEIVVLGHARRFGPRIRGAAGSVLGNRVPPGLPADRLREHRRPICRSVPDPDASDLVSVRTFTDAGAQAAHVAREIRQARVRREVPWRQMAVLVRSAGQIPALQRALRAAGIPAVVAADEIPLRQEPAVAALLELLEIAAAPGSASPERLLDVLTGPVGSLTPADVRRLGRALRAGQHRSGHAAPSSSSLIRDLALGPLLDPPLFPDPGLPTGDPIVVTVTRLTGLLVTAHRQIASGAEPADVLWTLWATGAHAWPERLRAAALGGDLVADHDLDAVMALFDTAERLAGRYPGFLGVRTFLAMLRDQQIPAESVADRGVDTDAVRVLTAHRAKGLEWDEVWVVGVQEGTWPDLRPRGTTLRVEEISVDGSPAGTSAADLLEEERRLLFVACTRARERLHISAVDAPDEAGDRPSRFLTDIAAHLEISLDEAASGRPAHLASLDGLVAELRSVTVDASAPATLRQAAAARLAALAAERDASGDPIVPLADPSRWWGIAPPTLNVDPLRDPDLPLALSGSMLDSVLQCPLKWYLEREVHADTVRGTASSFGSIVHAVADFVAKEQVPADLDAMDAEVDRIWSELRFEARWQSDAERARARAALERFLGYHRAGRRELISTETSLRAMVDVVTPSGRADAVALSGMVDRIERDDQGRLVAIDLKNMKSAVANKDVPEHGQLGVYQLLLHRGEVADDHAAGSAPRPVGGAALVQLLLDEGRGSTAAKVQMQEPLEIVDDEPTWVELRLGEAADIIRSSPIVARPCPACTYCAYRADCPAQPEGEQVLP